ncbi:MAG: N-acetylmuramoyl-L-alanine amidase [Myxococcales bacterium]|nr:N-acetylmuramoyl-L-alanine amidase [Myxococcales bacterium]
MPTPILLALLLAAPVPPVAAAPDAAAVWQGLLAAAPTAPDGRPLFPADARVTVAAGDTLFVAGAFDGADGVIRDLRVEAWVGALAAAGVDGARVMVPHGAGWRPLGGLDPTPPPARSPRPAGAPLAVGRPLGRGVLAGRRIALSAGHGWLDNGDGTWRTQRSRWAFEGCGACRGITEDFFNAELAHRYILPLLHAAGATVIPVREPDASTAEPVIVDDGGAGYGEAGAWIDGNSPGGYDGDYRVLMPEVEGEARFALGGAPGLRRLALRWREGDNRTTQARLTVDHRGGRTTLDLDQRRVGRLWFDLGAYWLDGNSRLTLSNAAGAGALIADALKIGGGLHPAAGHPWWQMSAQVYLEAHDPLAGVGGSNDVVIRPRHAEAAGADLYLSIHANASGVAGGSRANGLSTYRYNCQRYGDHSPAAAAVDCDEPPGSAALTEAVHREILARVRGQYDPGFRDVGTRVANFGELRELVGAPGVLVETGFFDNLADPVGDARQPDNKALHDPRWREAVALGVVTGVARYFDPAAPAVPERPTGLSAVNQADGTLALKWDAVEGATGYRVFIASDGRAFDDGVPTPGPRYVTAGLTPGRVYSFRVAATNRTGQGFASQAVAARFRGARLPEGVPAAEALLVLGYDRRDAWVQGEDNDLLYAVEHGDALAAVEGLFFDGALDERVGLQEEDLALDGYALVSVAAGKDSTEHDAVAPALRDALRAYLDGGGRLILSGEEIGWDLVERSDDPAEAAWLADVLGAEYVADDADAFAMNGAGAFAGVGEVALDDGSAGVYEVRYPDVWAPVGEGAELAFLYPDGTGAAVATDRSLLFGAGLEAVVPAAARRAVYQAAVGRLGVAGQPGDLDLDGAPDACERRHGFDDRDGADGASDTDGDGRDLAQECADGTDPNAADAPAADGGVPDEGPPEDLGAPDAVTLDQGVTPDAEADLGVVEDQAVAQDQALPLDGAVPDARPDAAPARDQFVPADRGVTVFVDAGVSRARQDDGGCRGVPGPAPLPGVVSLLGLAWALRPRRGGRRPGRR